MLRFAVVENPLFSFALQVMREQRGFVSVGMGEGADDWVVSSV